MVDDKRPQRYFPSPVLGYVSGACALVALALANHYLLADSLLAAAISVPFAIAGLTCSCIYIVRFRMEFMRHHKANTMVYGHSHDREINVTAGAIITACCALTSSGGALLWVFT